MTPGGFVLNTESLLLLQALEGAVDQAFADVQPCTFAPGDCLIKEGQPADRQTQPTGAPAGPGQRARRSVLFAGRSGSGHY